MQGVKLLRHDLVFHRRVRHDQVVGVVNPGYLSKREKAGTYAKMTVYPRSLTDEERGSSVVAHQVFERARVDIVRI